MGRGWLRQGSTLGVVVLACGCELLAGITDKRIGDAAGGGGASSTSTSTHATVTTGMTRSSSASSGLGGGTGGMAGPGGATGASGLAGSGGNATAGGAAPTTGVGGAGGLQTSTSVGGGGAATATVATTSTTGSTSSSSSSGAGGSVPWTCSVGAAIPATVNSNITGQPAIAYDPAKRVWGVAGYDNFQHRILYNALDEDTQALQCAPADCIVAPTTPNFTYGNSVSMTLAGTHFAITYGVDTGSGTLNTYTEVRLVTPSTTPFVTGTPGQSTHATAMNPPESDGIVAFNDPAGGALILVTVARLSASLASSATIAHRFDGGPTLLNSANLPPSFAASVAWSPGLQLVAVPFISSGVVAGDVQFFDKTLTATRGLTAFTVAADDPWSGFQGEGVAAVGGSNHFGVMWVNGTAAPLDTRLVSIDGVGARVPNTFEEVDVAAHDARTPVMVDGGTSYVAAWMANEGAAYNVRFRRFDPASLAPLETAPLEVLLSGGFLPSFAIAAGPKNEYGVVYRFSGMNQLTFAKIICTGPP